MSFEGAGQEDGLEIWRIEDFEAVPLDKAKYGNFHEGDSFIVLKTTRQKSGRIIWNIHFWLGSETSQDEAGTAAIKSVELDDQLGGSPVQHREVQEHEGNLFVSYFPKGIKYLPGGVKSGFKHVDPDSVEVRLFHIKGKRQIKAKQVALDPGLLNTTDSWILDGGKGKTVFVYMPSGASKMENFKATTLANQIRDEDHAGNATIEIIEELGEEFFAAMGTDAREVSEGGNEESDEAFESQIDSKVRLYKVSDSEGEMEVTEVEERPLVQEMLDESATGSKDCFILNSGTTSGIFAWIGKEATKDEKVKAMEVAEKFLAKEGLPKWTPVRRIVQGTETTMFKQFFWTWNEPSDNPCVGLPRFYPESQIAEWDVADLHVENRIRLLARSGGRAPGFCPDDGTGNKEVFRVENMEKVEVHPDIHGKFFGGDSYVITYSYQDKEGRDSYIVYFWQGKESSQDEKAASAILAVQADDELGGKAIQVRVVQGEEPRHFIRMFGGKMVVYTGGKASGFKNVHDHDTYDQDGTMLFRVRSVRGDDDVQTEQIQPESSSSLHSEDVFILESPSKTWVWKGSGSTEEEKAAALNIVPVISPDRDIVETNEGDEPDDFWEALGGQGEYPTTGSDLNKPILEPRLFHCRKSPSGKFRAYEIANFTKDDLVADDVMILDSGDEIYVWIGSESTSEEQELGLEMAKEYLDKDPTQRDQTNTPVFTVKEGNEPSSFNCCLQN